MKATGIVRCVDELGRIVLPKELRRSFGINEKDPLEIYVDEDKIVLKKYTRTCIFCNKSENLEEFKDKFICAECKKALKK